MMFIVKLTENCDIDLDEKEGEISDLIKEAIIFCKRVDAGEVRSVKTYTAFKNILEKLTGYTWKELKELK